MTITTTKIKGDVTGTNITIVPTTTIVTTTTSYRQCQGTAWPSGKCSSCGAYMGTGGVCLALIKVVLKPPCNHECDDSCRG